MKANGHGFGRLVEKVRRRSESADGSASLSMQLQSMQPAFPPTQSLPFDTSVLPVHIALASAVGLGIILLLKPKTQFLSDMRDPVETNSVLPIVHEIIAQAHKQSEPQPASNKSDLLTKIDLGLEGVPAMLCFPMGEVGEQLSRCDVPPPRQG